MRPVIRYQSQLLYRKSYKPSRVIRIRPTAKPNVTFRPIRRFGLKPQLRLDFFGQIAFLERNQRFFGSSPASGSGCLSSSVAEHVNSQFVSYPSY